MHICRFGGGIIIKVLIIEDDTNKLNAIISCLNEYSEFEITSKMSYHSGMRALLENSHDFLLLDMSMPMYDVTTQDTGGRPLPLAGRDILYKMRWKHVKTKAIVITQYEEFEGIPLAQLDSDLQSEFSEVYLGSVYYNTTHAGWKERLYSILDVIKSSEVRNDNGSNC